MRTTKEIYAEAEKLKDQKVSMQDYEEATIIRDLHNRALEVEKERDEFHKTCGELLQATITPDGKTTWSKLECGNCTDIEKRVEITETRLSRLTELLGTYYDALLRVKRGYGGLLDKETDQRIKEIGTACTCKWRAVGCPVHSSK